MTVIETIESKLKKYPLARYKTSADMITVEAADSNGFSVWLVQKNPGYTVGYDGWHDEFEDEGEALNAFAFGLSEECRLKVIQRGDTDCAWIVEGKTGDRKWTEDSTTGLLLTPFWRKKSVVYRQNNLIKETEQVGAGDAEEAV